MAEVWSFVKNPKGVPFGYLPLFVIWGSKLKMMAFPKNIKVRMFVRFMAQHSKFDRSFGALVVVLCTVRQLYLSMAENVTDSLIGCNISSQQPMA